MSRKNLIRFGSFVSCLVFLCVACAPRGESYGTLSGEKVVFSDFDDKVVFINYWAEWCEPCRVEVPELNAFAERHGDDVKVLSVNFDGVSGDELARQATALGIEFDTLLRDPRPMLGVAAATALPETIVIGRDGTVFKTLRGPQTQDGLEALLLSVP